MLNLMADNRLLVRIERTRAALAARVRIDNGQPLPESFDAKAFEATLDNDPLEHFAFQTAQARAHAMGRITTAEAQTIFIALGDPPSSNGWAAETDLATKLVVTQIMAELVGR